MITPLILTPEECGVLLILLEFHDDDEPDEHYSHEAFKSLKEKLLIALQR